MKDLFKILKYLKNYPGFVALNVLFNILSVFFNLFSLAMIVPFLRLLFDKTSLVYQAPPFAFTTDSIVQNFNYIISKIIIEKGEVNALMFISLMVVILFFF